MTKHKSQSLFFVFLFATLLTTAVYMTLSTAVPTAVAAPTVVDTTAIVQQVLTPTGITNGLIGHWSFDDGTDPTSDNSGYDHDGDLLGDPTFTTTIPAALSGQAIVLDGNGDYIEVQGAESDFDLQDLTIAFWIKTTGFDQYDGLVTKGDQSWRVHEADGTGDIEFHANGIGGIRSTQVITDNVWHHFAVTYDGATATIYIDGTLDVSGSRSGTIEHTDDRVFIGNNSDHWTRYFDGGLDDVRIYNRALSEDEVLQLYNNIPDRCFVEADGDAVLDYSSPDASALQTAVDNANPGDTLKIAGTCAGVQETAGITQTVYISQNLTLQGGYTTTNWLAPPDPNTYPTVLDAENSGRVVYIASGAEVTLAGLTIQNGFTNDNGSGIYNNATLALSQVKIISNTANTNGDGGGLYNDTLAIIEVSQSTIAYNQARYGGGITNQGQLSLIESNIRHNTTTGDGAGIQNNGILTATGTTIAYNIADDDAGGMYNTGILKMVDSIVSDNQALGNNHNVGGGGIWQFKDGVVPEIYLIDSTIVNNTSNNNGGGLYISNSGILTTTNSTIEQNKANAQGGGLYVDGNSAQVLLDETTIDSNSATSSGGGLYLNNANITIIGGQIISNTASGGGGVFHYNSGTSVFSGTHISYNRANNGGGLMNNWDTRHIFTNTVLSHNQATSGDGGGFFLINGGWASFVDSTVFSNTASSDGGGLFNDLNSTMHLTNTIVSHNQAVETGGGIRNDKFLTLHGGQIISNNVTGISRNGGGLYLGNSNAVVTQTGVLTLAYNQANFRGGGLYVADGRISMNGARILSNSADSEGGAIYQASNADGITVTNSCLVFNSDTAVHHAGGPVLSATGNWWGMSDGPSEAGSGHGDSINNASNIDASGFLTNAPVGCPAYTPVLTIMGGNNQSTEINQSFGQALSVTLAMTETARPLADEVITFTGPSSGAGIAPTVITATTDVDGLAVITPTANSDWGSYEVVVTADLASEPVTFTLQNYTFFTLTTAINGDGSGSVTADGVYTSGTEVMITATANMGSYFTGWTGDASGLINPLTVMMDNDKSITATFDLLTYTLSTTTVGNGSITIDPSGGTYNYGTVVTLTATADTGWSFTEWGGDCSGTDTCVLTMTADRDVTATFDLTTYQIYMPVIIKPQP